MVSQMLVLDLLPEQRSMMSVSYLLLPAAALMRCCCVETSSLTGLFIRYTWVNINAAVIRPL